MSIVKERLHRQATVRAVRCKQLNPLLTYEQVAEIYTIPRGRIRYYMRKTRKELEEMYHE